MPSRLTSTKLSPVRVYKMHAALLHLLESREKKLPMDLYQDMYAKLLQLGNMQIVRLYESLKAGKTASVFSFLNKRPYKDGAPFMAMPESCSRRGETKCGEMLKRALNENGF